MTVSRDDGLPVRPPAQLFRQLGLADLDGSVLERALVHSSFAHERASKGERVEHNGRLEFLGDAVLDLVVSQHLFMRCPDLPEGQLTRLRAGLVAAPSLAARARELGIGDCMYLARGEALGGGRDRESVLAEALEALVAAAFIAGGWDRARSLAASMLNLEHVHGDPPLIDPKSRLQELTQGRGLGIPSYRVESRTGPDHDPRFQVEVLIGGAVSGRGEGCSKKAAENEAALRALEAWDERRRV